METNKNQFSQEPNTESNYSKTMITHAVDCCNEMLMCATYAHKISSVYKLASPLFCIQFAYKITFLS